MYQKLEIEMARIEGLLSSDSEGEDGEIEPQTQSNHDDVGLIVIQTMSRSILLSPSWEVAESNSSHAMTFNVTLPADSVLPDIRMRWVGWCSECVGVMNLFNYNMCF